MQGLDRWSYNCEAEIAVWSLFLDSRSPNKTLSIFSTDRDCLGNGYQHPESADPSELFK